MIIAYLLLLAVVISFKMLHWPGASLFLLVSPLLPLTDIFVQLLRKRNDKLFRILTSLAVFGFSIFLQFEMLNWPGAKGLLVFALMTLLPFLVMLVKKKFMGISSLRYYYLTAIAVFSMYLFYLKPSAQMEFFMLEDPMDKNEHLPPFVLQRLAFHYYSEGEQEKAATLIEIALYETSLRLKEKSDGLPQKWQEKNLESLREDATAIAGKKWYTPGMLFY